MTNEERVLDKMYTWKNCCMNHGENCNECNVDECPWSPDDIMIDMKDYYEEDTGEDVL